MRPVRGRALRPRDQRHHLRVVIRRSSRVVLRGRAVALHRQRKVELLQAAFANFRVTPLHEQH
jgi:hypothetical protein